MRFLHDMGEFVDDKHFLMATYEAGIHVEQRKAVEELHTGKRKRKFRTQEGIRARTVKVRERRKAPSCRERLARGTRQKGQGLGKWGIGAPRKKLGQESPLRRERSTEPDGKNAGAVAEADTKPSNVTPEQQRGNPPPGGPLERGFKRKTEKNGGTSQTCSIASQNYVDQSRGRRHTRGCRCLVNRSVDNARLGPRLQRLGLIGVLGEP